MVAVVVAAGGLLELGLLVASAATTLVTESRGFRDALAQAAPTWLSAGLDGLRRGLTSVVGALGGPHDAIQAAAVLLVVGLALAGLAYVAALAAQPTRVLGLIVVFGLVFQLTLLVMPGLLSTDLLTYATYGRLAAVYGQNPYLAAPSAVAADPLVQWLDTRPEHASPYGPLWTLLSIGLAWLTAGLAPLLQALSYRLLGSLAMLAGTAVVWRLTREPARVLLFAWNPLLLVESVGNGHNDGLMMVVALAGLLLVERTLRATGPRGDGLAEPVERGPAGDGLANTIERGPGADGHAESIERGPGADGHAESVERGSSQAGPAARAGFAPARPRLAPGLFVGLLLVGLAALVKYVPGLLLVYVGAVLARRWPRLVAGAAVAVGVIGVVLWLPWLAASGPGVLLTSLSAGGERYVNALLDLPTGWLATHVVDRSGQDVAAAEAAVRAGPRALVRVLFLAYVAWELVGVWRRQALAAAVEAGLRSYLVALLLVVTQVLSWYFTWPLALAAVLGWRSTLARIAVAYGVLYLPVFYAIHADLVPGGGESWALLLLAWAILPLLILLPSRSGLAALASKVERPHGLGSPRAARDRSTARRRVDHSTTR